MRKFKIGDKVKVKQGIKIFSECCGYIKFCSSVNYLVYLNFQARIVEFAESELELINEKITIRQQARKEIDNLQLPKTYSLSINDIYKRDLEIPENIKLIDFRPVRNGDYYLDVLTGKVSYAENVRWIFVRLIVQYKNEQRTYWD